MQSPRYHTYFIERDYNRNTRLSTKKRRISYLSGGRFFLLPFPLFLIESGHDLSLVHYADLSQCRLAGSGRFRPAGQLAHGDIDLLVRLVAMGSWGLLDPYLDRHRRLGRPGRTVRILRRYARSPKRRRKLARLHYGDRRCDYGRYPRHFSDSYPVFGDSAWRLHRGGIRCVGPGILPRQEDGGIRSLRGGCWARRISRYCRQIRAWHCHLAYSRHRRLLALKIACKPIRSQFCQRTHTFVLRNKSGKNDRPWAQQRLPPNLCSEAVAQCLLRGRFLIIFYLAEPVGGLALKL